MTNKSITADQQPTTNSQQIALLKKHFANCFDKHGSFIPDKLQEIVQASGVALSKEGYSLNWLGKSYARLLANENIRTLLKADSVHNAQPVNASSQNLLIKGDNLEVLKHLMGAYSEQVKMIYIDPPYNTGSDGFVYQDDRKFTVEQLSNLAGIDEDQAKRILEFTTSSSNSHSAWLTFMYPRLYLAKQLLRDDGVIFISIDDNEQAQLKVLCDEVFGEENFVACIAWKKRSSPDARDTIGSIHDWILCYVKKGELIKTTISKIPLSAERIESFGNPDSDSRGFWASVDMTGMTGRATKDQYFTVTLPSGRSIKPPTGRSWGLAEKTYLELCADNRIWFGQSGDSVPRIKRFLSESKGQVVPSFWDSSECGTNDEANKEVREVLELTDIFDSPKPVRLIARMLNIGTDKSKSNIILDFFAGSGTTAHAVMQLNAEDNGNRKFICVQIDEATNPKSGAYKAGYKTIFDITQTRITKAAAKIQAEHPDHQGDLGFKVFETIPMFDTYLDAPEELTENLHLFDIDTLSQDDRRNLMLTWALRDGIKLGAPLTPVTLGGYTAYAAGKALYFVEPDISLDAVVALLEQLDNNPDFSPSRLVVLGYLLDSKVQREMTEAVKHYNNRKGIVLTLDIRYN